jgi:hypothetical protein
MDMLKKNGWTCQVVERWNPFARKRLDLFGFIDIVAIHPKLGVILGVQTTTAGNMNARLKKIEKEPRALDWVSAGAKVAVHGWKKLGKRSPTPGKWYCEIKTFPFTEDQSIL